MSMNYIKPRKLKVMMLIFFGIGVFGIVDGIGILGNNPNFMSLIGIISICLSGFFGLILLTQKSRSDKKRKKSRVQKTIHKKPRAVPTQDETQFWVCPNCGNNTEMKDERQYCFSCKIYLSI